MRKGLTVLAMAFVSLGASACVELEKPRQEAQTEEFRWIVDTFDDIKVLQYKIPGFEDLSLDQKKLIYYLNQAALSGRDIIFDQNFKYNLPADAGGDLHQLCGRPHDGRLAGIREIP